MGTAEAGWFRMVVARERSELEEGLQRLGTFLLSQRKLSPNRMGFTLDGEPLSFPSVGHFNFEHIGEAEELDLHPLHTPPLSPPPPVSPGRQVQTSSQSHEGGEEEPKEKRRASFSNLADDSQGQLHEIIVKMEREQLAIAEEEAEREKEARRRMSTDSDTANFAAYGMPPSDSVDWTVYGKPTTESDSTAMEEIYEPIVPVDGLNPLGAAQDQADTGDSEARPPTPEPSPDESSPANSEKGLRCDLLYHSELSSQAVSAYDSDELLREVFAVFPKVSCC